MGVMIAPPGSTPGGSGSPGTNAEQALFVAARRRRRRRRAAGIAVVVAAVAVLAVSAATWLPRALGQGAGSAGAVGAAAAGHAAAWQARISYRVVTAGVLEAYGSEDIRYSGHNWDSTSAQTWTARGPSPGQTISQMQRSVNGKEYGYYRVHGRMRWVAELFPAPGLKIRDPRALLSALRPYTPFLPAGHQVIDGTPMTVLRATDPAALTRRALLPAVYTSGQAVAALTVWADPQGVVHRLAFTFHAPAGISLATPVSKAALRRYQRAEEILPRLNQAGKRPSHRQVSRALRLQRLAMLQAYPVRWGTQVTTTTIAFLAIGQPDRITTPPRALSNHAYVRLTEHR